MADDRQAEEREEPAPPDEAAGGPSPPPEDAAVAESEQAREEPATDTEPASDTGTDTADEVPFSLEGLMDALRRTKVSDLLVSTASTLASVAYGKLEAGDLGETRAAIDAIGALLPLLRDAIDPGMLRDFEQALANLRVAYADAVASGQ